MDLQSRHIDGVIGLDFETYSAVDLPKHGLHRYVQHPTFRPLVAAVSVYDRAPLSKNMARSFDLVQNQGDARELRNQLISLLDQNYLIVAHNAGFEMNVLRAMSIEADPSWFIDSAAVARAMGYGSRLESAAPQMLGVDKMEEGRDLIRLFSIPGKYQDESEHFNPQVIKDNPKEWKMFQEYCFLDADLSAKIGLQGLTFIPGAEFEYNRLTMSMNDNGWAVDLESVKNMQQRYFENLDDLENEFRVSTGAVELNLNSYPQLKKWCADRGIKANSFDEKNVMRLLKAISKRMASPATDLEKYEDYQQVVDLLNTKQALGGSSLKKLQTILDTVGDDGRLRDQYLHCGAGQTWRTSGRSVQMQNLKRLHNPIDMENLENPANFFSNDELSENLRQVFTATHKDGALIVGDFSSVESRGLAWLADDQQKLAAFYNGKDLYKVQAELIYGTPYDSVTSEQRQTGKVGELSCGYGAGPGAVKEFASNMGVEMSEAEAKELVHNWRDTNPHVVALWGLLDEMLQEAVFNGLNAQVRPVGTDMHLHFVLVSAPASLRKQTQEELLSLEILLTNKVSGDAYLKRVFHGVHRRGRNVAFWKPSERKTGDLWRDRYIDPKTKQVRFYEIYGGKLSGILTQSLCREIFMGVALKVQRQLVAFNPNVTMVGQFHDELVLDWQPGGRTLPYVMEDLHDLMTLAPGLAGFPLDAEIKADYRYIK